MMQHELVLSTTIAGIAAGANKKADVVLRG
jgi:hypothetical protein